MCVCVSVVWRHDDRDTKHKSRRQGECICDLYKVPALLLRQSQNLVLALQKEENAKRELGICCLVPTYSWY